MIESPGSKKDLDVLQGIIKKISVDEARFLSQIFCQDPLTGLYKKALILYVFFLSLILLWPFEFSYTSGKNHVKWNDAYPGIDFMGEGQVISRPSSKVFYESLMKGKGFSLEVMISTANYQQGGPARIVSNSLNTIYRNFTLGQQGMDLIIRLRTKNTNLNGMDPMLIVEDVFTSTEPLHIFVSYNFYEQSVFVNGSLRTASTIPGGDFENWDPGYPLILGNEATGDRPWLGKIYYVAIYNYPKNARGIRTSYDALRSWIFGNVEMATPREGLVVRYLFNEKKGAKVTDSGALVEPLTLNIPDKIQKEGKPFLDFFLNPKLNWGSASFNEIVLNVILFIPLGFLLYATFASRMDGIFKPLLFVAVVGGAITLSAETLQYFNESRYSSMVDVIANVIGALLGAQLKIVYNNFLIRKKRIVCEVFEE